MKKHTTLIAALCASALVLAAFAQTVPPTPPAAPPVPTMAALTAERDELAGKLAASQKAQNDSAITAEYFKALAERNEALLRLTQAQADIAQLRASLGDVQSRYDLEKAKVEELLKKSGASAVTASKPAPSAK